MLLLFEYNSSAFQETKCMFMNILATDDHPELAKWLTGSSQKHAMSTASLREQHLKQWSGYKYYPRLYRTYFWGNQGGFQNKTVTNHK